jgi:sugar lactone lactonase YvrE
VLSAPQVRQPTGLAIDLRGPAAAPKWAYTADAATGRIVKFGTGGKKLLSWPYATPAMGTGAGLAVGGSGNLFVADPSAGTVSKFSPFGRLLARWTGFSAPLGVAVDRKGDVFVAERDAQRVTVLAPAGKVLARWSPGALYPPGGQSNPTGVAIGPPGQIYTSTTCVVGTTCGVGTAVIPNGESIDGLLEFFVNGSEPGHVMEMWFGLGHTAAGPAQPPDKDTEPFAAIRAITSDRQGWLYVAGTVWWRGGKPGEGVLAYTPYGYKWDTLYLPAQTPPKGVAVDSRGILYVAQGNRILAHKLGKRPNSPTG